MDCERREQEAKEKARKEDERRNKLQSQQKEREEKMKKIKSEKLAIRHAIEETKKQTNKLRALNVVQVREKIPLQKIETKYNNYDIEFTGDRQALRKRRKLQEEAKQRAQEEAKQSTIERAFFRQQEKMRLAEWHVNPLLIHFLSFLILLATFCFNCTQFYSNK